ncbi:hemicentin-1-like isoform X2 [Choristoneura fumiferana]|uniref:hemicentin-1-like isoform X2 n=1 Tax=Choristoneura fumiferana TaxID=7141 RepID=UPI003D157817
MTDDIAHVRQAAKSIMDIVLNEKSSQIEDIVLVLFGDPAWEFRKRTRDEAELKKALDDINLIGNPDCPEMCLSGIKMGLEESLPGSFLYVFTDASAKDYEKFEEIKSLSQEKQIQVLFVLTGDCGDFGSPKSQVYYKIAAASNGQVLTVSKENVGEVLDYVKETIKGDGTVLTSTMVHPTVGSESYVNFDIDDKIEYALVSTSGSDVTLKVSKDGIELPGKQVTWTKNVKVLKLVGITPGSYRAAVRGSSEVNVMVFGRTDFNFKFGFSNNEQNSLKYTETQPITGSETHLIISVKDDEHSVNIKNVEILDMSEMVIRRLNLINVGSNVFRTDKFLPPGVMFKIAVTATARSTGNPIRRIANTPVEPIKSVIVVAPEITDTEKYFEAMEDSEVNIHCRIRKGKPKPHVTWYFKQRGANQFKLLPDKTDDVLFMGNISTDDIGEYQCVAKNSAGQASHIVQLEVFGKPKFEDAPATIKAKENVPVTLKCKLRKGNPRPKITWSFQASGSATFTKLSNSDEELIIPALKLKDSGEYRCVAENRAGRDERTTLVTIVAAPEIESSTPSIIRVKENATISVPCRLSKGIPKPTMTWWYKDANSTEYTAIPDSNADVLHLDHIQLSKAGHYKCVAQNTVGQTEKDVQVIVEAAPEIERSAPSIIRVKEHAPISVPCRLSKGFPKPTITWWYKDTKSTEYTAIPDSNADVLHLVHIQLSKAGHYKCVAQNTAGQTEKEVQVIVEAAPEIERSTPSTIRVKEHAPISVPCRLSKGFPKAAITWWYKDTKSTEYTAIPDSNADVLHLDHIQLSKAGHYKCVAQNTVGQTEKDVQVIVEAAPEIERSTPSIIRVKEHAPISVPCRLSKGFPKPTITWWYKDTKSTEYTAIPDSNADVLHLDHIQLSKAGHYKCVAQNTVGQTEKVVQVIVEAAPEIERSAPSIIRVKEHAPISVPCRLSKGFPKPTITWWYKDTKSTEYTAIPDSNADVLHLDHIQLSKAGHYKCVAQNTAGQTEKDVQVIVEAAPEIEISAPSIIRVKEHAPISVPCRLSKGFPKPTITWWYKDTKSTEYTAIPDSNADVLHLDHIQLSKAGHYKCVAQNTAGQTEKDVQVIVEALIPEMAPQVTIDGPYEMDAEYDEPLQLKCKVSGYPEPDIIWEFDDLTGKTAQTDSTIELPSKFVSVLDINKVNKNATYTCKAINKLGIGTKSIVVKTKKKTYFNVLELPKDITIEYAKKGQIHCKVDAFPPASITWFKNYKHLTTDGNIELSADNSTLYIRSMAPYIADKYICQATNTLKREFAVFKVSIGGVEPPEINKTTYYVTAMKDANVDIHCDVIKGKPKPTITWLYNDQYSSSFSDLQYTSDTIHMDYLSADDKAIYRCIAENVVGTDSHDIELVILYPPELTKTTSPRIVKNEGEMVTLTCPVDGSPTPDVVWKLNGNKLLGMTHKIFRDGSIRFKATLNSNGNYECEASNDHGVVRINTKVDVIIPVNIEPPIRGTLEVMVGQDALLPCRADGFPPPVLSWVYHSKDPKKAPKTFSPSARPEILALPGIQLEQDGYYTCVAKNAGGSKNITYEVIVFASPFIQFTMKQFRAVSGDMMLRVPCYASGNPKPTITWTTNGLDIATGERYYHHHYHHQYQPQLLR